MDWGRWAAQLYLSVLLECREETRDGSSGDMQAGLLGSLVEGLCVALWTHSCW